MSVRRYHLCLAFPCAFVLWAVVTAIALAAAGDITTVAGTGTPGYSGDGGPATSARIFNPEGADVGPDGAIYFADTKNHRVRRVAGGVITTVAGTGTQGFAGDNGAATAARLSDPSTVSFDSDGHLLIADTGNHRIRHVDLSTGIITTEAGTGASGFSGDGGSATAARLNTPQDVDGLPGGGLLIADSENNRIRKVVGGRISTAAGDGSEGFSGDGGPATSARMEEPNDVEATSDGGFLVADSENHRVRKVSAAGLIVTVAGNGAANASGDGGPAVNAGVEQPSSLAATADGGFLIAQPRNHRIRQVFADGRIATVAGTGTPGYDGGEGGARPPTAVQLQAPEGVAVLGTGFLVVDTLNHRLRAVEGPPAPPAPTPAAGGGQPPAPAPGMGGPAAPTGPSLPPPVLGSTVQLAPAGGTVLVRRPGSRRSVVLKAGAVLPVGTSVDTTRGIVRLTSAADRAGTTQTADFSLGRFVVRQARNSPITELALRGELKGCAPRNSRARASAKRSGARSRKLWGSGKGRFRTRGRYSAATVRGTKWLTQDTCESTIVKVSEGLVEVRDLVRRKTVMVGAGKAHKSRVRR